MAQLRTTILISLTTSVLLACSANTVQEPVKAPPKQNNLIKESKPIKLTKKRPKNTVVKQTPNRQAFKVITKPLEVNKTMKEAYLLQLKATEFIIKKLEK